ncbi:uncharacterized protein LOC130628973 [Hydractinia symbiolongicarpus]|uniref:uncharacterized protein LOC130628973 n=1 Tax=Hydractinia symbiolongicarpus TaxID=13093 RepID=UPI00254AE619|nr:uncharacterized protein LOC130628973 [Hydractinia symbiolongicarpus]
MMAKTRGKEVDEHLQYTEDSEENRDVEKHPEHVEENPKQAKEHSEQVGGNNRHAGESTNCSSCSSAIAFILVAFLVSVSFLCLCLQHTRKKQWSFVIIYYPLIVYMGVSLIGITACHMSKSTFIDEGDNCRRPHAQQTLKYLVYLGYLFAAGNFLIDLFGYAMALFCSNNQYLFEYCTLSLYHLVRLLFVAGQLVFLQTFITDRIIANFNKMRFLIAFLIATNITAWMTIFFQFGILQGGFDGQSNIKEYTELHCKSNIFQIASEVEKYSDPFILEYSLLAITLLLNIYPRQTVEQIKREYEPWVIMCEDKRKSKMFFKKHEEYSSTPGLLAGMLIGLPVVAAYIFTTEKGPHYVYDVMYNYTIQGINHVIVIVISILAWKECLKYHKPDPDSHINKADYKVLLGTALLGFGIYHLLIIYSAVYFFAKSSNLDDKEYNEESKVTDAFMLIHSLINLISPFLQTFMIFKLHGYKKERCSDHAKEIPGCKCSPESRYSAALLRQYLLALVMINTMFWMSGSFIDMKASPGASYLITYKVVDKETHSMLWFLVITFSSPVSTFYRIHAAAMLFNIWSKFNEFPEFIQVEQDVPLLHV